MCDVNYWCKWVIKLFLWFDIFSHILFIEALFYQNSCLLSSKFHAWHITRGDHIIIFQMAAWNYCTYISCLFSHKSKITLKMTIDLHINTNNGRVSDGSNSEHSLYLLWITDFPAILLKKPTLLVASFLRLWSQHLKSTVV